MVSTVENNQDRDIVFKTVDNFMTVEVSFLKLLKCPFLNCQDQGKVNNWTFRALALLFLKLLRISWLLRYPCWNWGWSRVSIETIETNWDPPSYKKTSSLCRRSHFKKIISGGSRVWQRLGSQIPSNFQAGCPSSPIQKGTSTTRSPTSPM